MTILHDTYTALPSGLATKTGNEIHRQDEDGYYLILEPIDIEKETYTVRHYYSNGQLHWEENYQSDPNKLEHIANVPGVAMSAMVFMLASISAGFAVFYFIHKVFAGE